MGSDPAPTLAQFRTTSCRPGRIHYFVAESPRERRRPRQRPAAGWRAAGVWPPDARDTATQVSTWVNRPLRPITVAGQTQPWLRP